MFERFAEDARAVVAGAQAQAVGLDHGWIGTEHLLLSLLDDPERRATEVLAGHGVTAPWVRDEVERIVGRGTADLDADALATLGIDLDAVRERVERTFGPGALARRRGRRGGRGGVCIGGHVPFTARAKKVLELALREAVARGDRSIGSEHLLLGIAREGDGVAAGILRSRGVDHAVVEAALQRDGAR
jgi:ATP-dependent Clp protease ATP-binding subunit ClpA